jgi:hypothetical protein
MAEVIRRGLDLLIAEEEPTRADLWAEAEALVGAFVDANGAGDVAARHDAYLDEAYR